MKLGWSPDVVHCHGWMSALVPVYMKTTYKDDPTFKSSKVIYSAYNNCFTEKLNADFTKKAIMNGMTDEHTEAFKACDNDAMHIGAISYSDAVVFGDAEVSEEVLKFVKNSQKPTLSYEATSDYENYYNLYEEIANEELVSLA